MKLIALALVAIGAIATSIALFYEQAESPVFSDVHENRSIKEDVSNNPESKMIEIYDSVKVSENLRVLNISGRSFSGSLKAEVGQLSNLVELNISDNNFTGLPAEVGRLEKLEVLNLSNNPLTGLPYEIGNLKNLKTLDLRGTSYSKQDLEVIKEGLPSGVSILISGSDSEDVGEELENDEN